MYSKKFNSLLRPTRQASICPHVFFLRQCHSLFMSTSMPTPTPLPVPVHASPCFHACAQWEHIPHAHTNAHVQCPMLVSMPMPMQFQVFVVTYHIVTRYYLSWRFITFLAIQYYIWTMSGCLLIIHMHVPITLPTPRPMPLHMPMHLPMPLLVLMPLHLRTFAPCFSQNYQVCCSLPPILQTPIDQLLPNLKHYSPCSFSDVFWIFFV